MKYRPELPARFGSYENALGFCRHFFNWYIENDYLLTAARLMSRRSRCTSGFFLREERRQGAFNALPSIEGVGMLTPATVHYGQAEQVRAYRHEVLLAAYAPPARFVCGCPQRQQPRTRRLDQSAGSHCGGGQKKAAGDELPPAT